MPQIVPLQPSAQEFLPSLFARPEDRLRPVPMATMIGVGRTDWVRSPLPPNRTGGSPASGSPVDGSPARGLTDLSIGVVQVEKPMFGKESIGPPEIVEGARDPRPAMLFAQDIAQSATDPAVERRECR